MQEIKTNLKTTSAKFDREDNEEKVKASQEVRRGCVKDVFRKQLESLEFLCFRVSAYTIMHHTQVIDKRRKIMGAFDVVRNRNLDMIKVRTGWM